MKQDHGESATKEAKVVQCDVSQEGNSIKVETGELKVNLTREEDVIEAAAADDVGAEKVEEEREPSTVMEKDEEGGSIVTILWRINIPTQ